MITQEKTGKKPVRNLEMRAIHKKAARLFLAGLSVRAIAKQIGVGEESVQDWMYRIQFVKYVEELEKKYHRVLDKEIITMRREAFHVLRESLTSEDLYQKRWAVQTILNTTQTQEMTLNINSSVQAADALDDKAKKVAKEYMMLTSGNGRSIDKGAEA